MNGQLPCALAGRAWGVSRRARLAMDQGDPRAFPADAFQILAGCRFPTLPLSRERGGIGLGRDSGSSGTLLELLSIAGWGDLSLARRYEGHINALLLVQQFGASDQSEHVALDAQRGLVFGVCTYGGLG